MRATLGLCLGSLRLIFGLYWGYIRVISGFYWGYIGIMENKAETTLNPKPKNPKTLNP